MHKTLKRKDLVYFYFIILLAIIIILILTNSNLYLWIASAFFILLGILYSLLIKLKDKTFLNYIAIALAYAGLSSAIGFFSGSGSLNEFIRWIPIILFLILVDFGYSITKDYSDIYGDKIHNKKTLPVIFGKEGSLKIQVIIITIAYIYLASLIISGAVGSIFIILFLSYGIALYLLFKIYESAEAEVHNKMHHHSQRNGLLVRILIICILLII
jgi:4-hydroxybenzoate polyprenyltransferase